MDKGKAVRKSCNDLVAGLPTVSLATEQQARRQDIPLRKMAEVQRQSLNLDSAVYIDLAETARNKLIGLWAKDDVAKKAMVAGMELQRAQLAGPNPSPLEALLAERVVLNLYQANLADAMMSKALENPKIGDYIQRFQDRANARFLQACKTLAQVRHLLGPSVQINVAERQINVLHAGQPTAGGR